MTESEYRDLKFRVVDIYESMMLDHSQGFGAYDEWSIPMQNLKTLLSVIERNYKEGQQK